MTANVETGTLWSAFPLDEAIIAQIEERFSTFLGKKVKLTLKVEPEIIGGIIVAIGDRIYDGSLKGQLNRMREHLLGLQKGDMVDLGIDLKSSGQLINMESVGEFIRDRIQEYEQEFDVENVGRVIRSGDGVVLIGGLSDCRYGELLRFEGDVFGIAFNLEEDTVGAVLLNNQNSVMEGTTVYSTGRVVQVPVGEGLLGRVVNPLGQPLDGKGPIRAEGYREIEQKAPGIYERDMVNQPLQTGLLAIDSMIPIGRGQRQLIIGDRQTGKTAIALDTIVNQRDKDVICVYVAIGQKASTVSQIINTLRDMGAMDYTIVVSATASDSAPMQYIAPYAGCAMAEYFMYKGKDVLIVYDDLSKHAIAYRTLSLLLRRPPGREAYPGDIFYLHSRLLERSAKLSKEKGGGSLTALPIIETQAGDISGYIPTNVISITDGQIFLEDELFFAGIRPAVNVGLSVSRVGKAAQIKAMAKVSGTLRLELAQYRELQVFSQFSSELDPSTQELLAQGERITEILKQEQYHPMDVAHQVVLLYVVTRKMLLDVPVNRIQEFKQQFIEYMECYHRNVIENIRKTGDITEEDMAEIEAAVKDFKQTFLK
ncbi:MAG: F-type H+/Na+-transporting ATPase subunit alpha [Clostridiales bacterium]|nr:F-type H+/Na+-transporting ATPase subunit alpha [Clostridiales bacterium]